MHVGNKMCGHTPSESTLCNNNKQTTHNPQPNHPLPTTHNQTTHNQPPTTKHQQPTTNHQPPSDLRPTNLPTNQPTHQTARTHQRQEEEHAGRPACLSGLDEGLSSEASAWRRNKAKMIQSASPAQHSQTNCTVENMKRV